MATTVQYLCLDGEVLGEERGSETRDYVPDALGSVRYALGANQSVDASFTYWPYGETRTEDNGLGVSLQFVGNRGYYRDKGANGSVTRTYVQARELEPRDGRWYTVDPKWPKQFVYAYVENMPTRYLDYSGKQLIGLPPIPFPKKDPLPPGYQIQHEIQGTPWFGLCGGYRMFVNWTTVDLAGAPAEENSGDGWIIQEVFYTQQLSGAGCTTSPPYIPGGPWHYWEAWERKGGITGTGHRKPLTPDGHDLYQQPDASCFSGFKSTTGYPVFFPKLTIQNILGLGFRVHSTWMSGLLFATEKPPAGWVSAPALIHSIRNSFDCCGQGLPEACKQVRGNCDCQDHAQITIDAQKTIKQSCPGIP